MIVILPLTVVVGVVVVDVAIATGAVFVVVVVKAGISCVSILKHDKFCSRTMFDISTT